MIGENGPRNDVKERRRKNVKRRSWEKASNKVKRNVAPIGWRKRKSWKLRGKKRNGGRGDGSIEKENPGEFCEGILWARGSVERGEAASASAVAGEREEDGENGRAIGPARLMTRGIKQY